MKKILLAILIVIYSTNTDAQNIYTMGFNGNTTGWAKVNQSTLANAAGVWTIPTYGNVTVGTPTPSANPFGATVVPVGQVSAIPDGQSGGANSFAIVGKNSTTSLAVNGAILSNWLISPNITVQNGNVISFYTRCGTASSSLSAAKADRLEVRLSTQGAFTTSPTFGPNDIGDFSTVIATINPNQTATGYPTEWTRYSYTVTGLTDATSCKIGFRYNILNGGPNGQRSDVIGIDSFSVDTTELAINESFSQNFEVFPNPVSSKINVISKNNNSINELTIADVNGRVVKIIKNEDLDSEINIEQLKSGIYFLKVLSDLGSSTTKILKN